MSARSAPGRIVSVALSEAGDAVTSEVAVAVFVTVVPRSDASARTRTVMTAPYPAAIEPSAQVIAVWLPLGAVVHAPWDVVIAANASPAGSVSVMVAFVAVDGPLLRTWILNPPSVPRLIVPASAALLTESTALGEAPAAAVD